MKFNYIQKITSALALLLLLLIMPTSGQQELRYPYPRDEREGIPGPTFTTEMALWRLYQMKEWLGAYDALFSNCRRILDAKVFYQVMEGAGVASDMRTIGFANGPKVVEVTLRRQNLVIAMLEYELAKERYESNKIKSVDLKSAEQHYRKVNELFQDYFNQIHWSD